MSTVLVLGRFWREREGGWVKKEELEREIRSNVGYGESYQWPYEHYLQYFTQRTPGLPLSSFLSFFLISFFSFLILLFWFCVSWFFFKLFLHLKCKVVVFWFKLLLFQELLFNLCLLSWIEADSFLLGSYWKYLFNFWGYAEAIVHISAIWLFCYNFKVLVWKSLFFFLFSPIDLGQWYFLLLISSGSSEISWIGKIFISFQDLIKG